MVSAILNRRLSRPENITVSDVSEPRRQYLAQRYGVTATDDNIRAAEGADILVLAVKPQNLAGVLEQLGGHLRAGLLVLSIIAGAKIKTMRRGLKHRRIVRSMPNTPARIGEGVTVWTATPQVTERQIRRSRSILGAMGMEIQVNDERYLDMSTSISGSGPAYFFYFVESLVEAAVKLGIPRDMAEKLASQTISGAAQLIKQSGTPPAELRRAVTSKGGTTAAALEVLDESGFHRMVLQAVKAAYDRARELGG